MTQPRARCRLQAQHDIFVEYDNTVRPHRSVQRRRPLEAFEAREKARPEEAKIAVVGYRIRRDRVDRSGRGTLRDMRSVHHIGVGSARAGWRVVLLVNGLDVRVIGLDGSPLRRLVLDPTKDYQRIP